VRKLLVDYPLLLSGREAELGADRKNAAHTFLYSLGDAYSGCVFKDASDRARG
jgi:hypothetical protein